MLSRLWWAWLVSYRPKAAESVPHMKVTNLKIFYVAFVSACCKIMCVLLQTHVRRGGMTVGIYCKCCIHDAGVFCVVTSVIFYVAYLKHFSLTICYDQRDLLHTQLHGCVWNVATYFLHVAQKNVTHRIFMLQGSDSGFRLLSAFISHFLLCMQWPLGPSDYHHLF